MGFNSGFKGLIVISYIQQARRVLVFPAATHES